MLGLFRQAFKRLAILASGIVSACLSMCIASSLRLRDELLCAISSEDCAAWETQRVPRQSHGTMQNAARYALQDARCALSKMERRSHEGVAHDAREADSRRAESLSLGEQIVQL